MCAVGIACGAANCGAANTCLGACVPRTCASIGATCGSIADDCGGTLRCGTCGTEFTCSTNLCIARDAGLVKADGGVRAPLDYQLGCSCGDASAHVTLLALATLVLLRGRR
jgi:uncharacterized protein (TIGR03382 family)